MKYSTAVRRLESVAEDLSTASRLDGFVVSGAFVFGELLYGPDTLEFVSAAFVVDLPVEEVTWGSWPAEAEVAAVRLRLDKVAVLRRWRPEGWPVWNHQIKRAVLFWTRSGGTDAEALGLLATRRFDELTFVAPPSPEAYLEQLRVERDAAQRHLHRVLDSYHDRDWRRDHRGLGRYPEDHLWWAAEAYRELNDAVRDALDDQT